MTARAYVEVDHLARGIRLSVAERSDAATVVRLWGAAGRHLIIDNNAEVPVDGPNGAPYVMLGEDEARAIYEALAEHFGHVGHDGRTAREDHLAERARVDRLIGMLDKALLPS